VPKTPGKRHDDQSATDAAILPANDAGPPAAKNPKKGSTKGAKGGKGKGNGEAAKPGAPGRPGPESVTGNTRVNLALPFSKIEVQEPSNELIELVALLSELVGALTDWVPEETLHDIRTRTEALRARLST
jgi:hypothetical protein